MKKALFFGIMILTMVQSAFTQKGWELGGWLGTATYFGDLNTNYDLSMPGAAGGLVARHNFNNRLSMRFGATFGQLMADDATSDNAFERARNLSFKSNIVEAAALLEFNFLPYMHGSRDEFFSPYLFLGLNFTHFNPKAEFNGELVELRPLGTEGQFRGEEYYSITGGFTYGFGLKLDLNYEWSLNFELGARGLFTDYLDDVSTVYPDKEDLLDNRGQLAVDLSDRSIVLGLENSQIGEEGTQRGNSNNKDNYVILGVGIMYYFGDIRCPDYGRRK